MWISPKPMVDGFVKIFGEFRNGCDEKSATVLRHLRTYIFVKKTKIQAVSLMTTYAIASTWIIIGIWPRALE